MKRIDLNDSRTIWIEPERIGIIDLTSDLETWVTQIHAGDCSVIIYNTDKAEAIAQIEEFLTAKFLNKES